MSAHRDPDQFVGVIDEGEGTCYLFLTAADADAWAQGANVTPFAELDATSVEFKQMLAASNA